MWVAVWAALKRYYRIVASCSVLAGIVLAFFQDVHNVALDRLSALIWPPLPAEQTCVEDYFSDTIDRPPGSYLIIVTDMANDPDRAQSILIDRTLRRLIGEDLGSAIQMETIPCTIFSAAGNAAKRNEDAKQLALENAERAGADVVLWGEVIAIDDLIALKMTHTAETGGRDYRVEDNSLNADFGEDLGRLIAAKMLTLSSLTSQEEGTYVVPRMNRAIKLTTPLINNPPEYMDRRSLGQLFFSHGKALHLQGSQSGDTSALQEANFFLLKASAFYTKSANPREWAGVQAHLGFNSLALGRVSLDSRHLRMALARATTVLAVIDKKTDPLAWAEAQNLLGSSHISFSAIDRKLSHIYEAEDAFRNALTFLNTSRTSTHWGVSAANLGYALMILGKGDEKSSYLNEAEQTLNGALDVILCDKSPVYSSGAQHNLGMVLLELGNREKDGNRLGQAIRHFENALMERTYDRNKLESALSYGQLGVAKMLLADINSDLGLAREALETLDQADAALLLYKLENSKRRAYLPSFAKQLTPTQALIDRLSAAAP